ncbi:Heat shock protein DnaJ family protein [Phytophthora cinnamomi]|uniref:Heat shock protein DnaJ family protein n=1 Tax=Phytophthora cinnamomi TaxID=4785 RepID=UPI00355A6EC1|nr:Heat shock protein DnaJ family protein [Phytophthora cinnamomi]
MVLVTLFFAGFLAVCAVLVVQMMRADEAAFARRLEQRMPQVQPKHVHVKVSLAQLYTGDHVEINADRTIVCSKCAGTGHDISAGYHECPKCKGTGVSESIEQVGPFQQRVRSVCNICQGRGRIANSKCEVCGGLGLRHESTTLNVHIERGVRHGDELLLAREGDQAPLHIPGHVVVHVTMAPHPVFTRRGDDLELTLEISLLEERYLAASFTTSLMRRVALTNPYLLLQALVGFSRELSHLDGHTIKLDREAVVQPTTVWTILNEGMPIRQRPGEFGDLLVHFNIAYPSELDAADKSVVCQLLRD